MTNFDPLRRGLTRRGFLGGTVGAAAAVPLFSRTGRALSGGGRDILVHVFLRGGMDGLTTCVPWVEDTELNTLRPDIRVPAPGQPNGATDLDGYFGVPEAAAPLLTPYSNGHLAFVHATGSTDPTRSHFEAFRKMELGIPNQPGSPISTGWLARHLQTTSPVGTGPLRAIAVNNLMPQTLAGAPSTLPIRDLDAFLFPGNPATATQRQAHISAMFDDEPPPLGAAALDSLASIDLLATVDYAGYVPEPGAVYPAGNLGSQMMQVAATIKAGLDVEVYMLELGGWDLHNALGPISGDMYDRLDELTRSLEAFYLDLLASIDCVTVVVLSEFGRRAAQNSSLGLDHGHGNCMLVMGGNVNGAQVITDNWPTLADLDANGDLKITIDYRDVLGEILEERLENTSLDTVFPNHTAPAGGWYGVTAG